MDFSSGSTLRGFLRFTILDGHSRLAMESRTIFCVSLTRKKSDSTLAQSSNSYEETFRENGAKAQLLRRLLSSSIGQRQFSDVTSNPQEAFRASMRIINQSLRKTAGFANLVFPLLFCVFLKSGAKSKGLNFHLPKYNPYSRHFLLLCSHILL